MEEIEWKEPELLNNFVVKIGKKYRRKGNYKCFCGNLFTSETYDVKTKHTTSCGCIQKSIISKQNTIHGLSKSPIYNIWNYMRQRCFNHKHKNYNRYGGRGITVCKRWLTFQNFYDDMFLTWKPGLSIDRINNEGNYEPSNCKWSTQKEQVHNSSNVSNYTYLSKTQCITQWAKEYNINPQTLRDRLHLLKWDFEKSINTPVRKFKDKSLWKKAK